LLRAEYPVPLPVGNRPSPEDVAAWLERLIRSEDVSVQRVGETTLEFHSRFKLSRSEDPLASFARGEVEVVSGADGPILEVRANPHLWRGLIPLALVGLFGWTDAAEILRWGAGLGGIVIGGVLLFLNWSSLKMFLISTAANLRTWRTGRPYLPLPEDRGAA
jgi:hypothetical protein